jgi:hypothetical protein
MLVQFDFIFYKGETPIARIIQRLTKSDYSHVAMVLDGLHLLQSDWRTPVSIHHLEYPVDHYDVFRLRTVLTAPEAMAVILFIRERLTAGYDFKLIFSRFFNLLLGTPIFSSKTRYNCDELIVEAFRHVGINLVQGDVTLSPDILSKSELIYPVDERRQPRKREI